MFHSDKDFNTEKINPPSILKKVHSFQKSDSNVCNVLMPKKRLQVFERKNNNEDTDEEIEDCCSKTTVKQEEKIGIPKEIGRASCRERVSSPV